MKLADTLRGIPNGAFYKGRGDDRRPDYNAVFTYVLRTSQADKPGFDVLCRRIEAGEVLNLSAFQRAVAMESARRKGAKKS